MSEQQNNRLRLQAVNKQQSAAGCRSQPNGEAASTARQTENNKSATSLQFTVNSEQVDQLVALARVQAFELNPADVVEGMDLLPMVRCKACGKLPADPIYECTKCENVLCLKCSGVVPSPGCKDAGESNELAPKSFNMCPLCKKKSQKKPMNRKVKEIVMKQIKFRHECRGDRIAKEKQCLDEALQLTNVQQIQLKRSSKMHSLKQRQSAQIKDDFKIDNLDFEKEIKPLTPKMSEQQQVVSPQIRYKYLNQNPFKNLMEFEHSAADKQSLLDRDSIIGDMRVGFDNDEIHQGKRCCKLQNNKVQKSSDFYDLKSVFSNANDQSIEQQEDILDSVSLDLHTCKFQIQEQESKQGTHGSLQLQVLARSAQVKGGNDATIVCDKESIITKKRDLKYSEKASYSGQTLIQNQHNSKEREIHENTNYGKIYTYKELLDHLDSDCPHKMRCPQGCTQQLYSNAKELQNHIINDCPFTVLQCKICQTPVQKMNVKNHGYQDCVGVLLNKNRHLETQNKELVKQVRRYEEDSYFQESSDYQSATSEDSSSGQNDDSYFTNSSSESAHQRARQQSLNMRQHQQQRQQQPTITIERQPQHQTVTQPGLQPGQGPRTIVIRRLWNE